MPKRDKIIESPAHDVCGRKWADCKCCFCACCGLEWNRCPCPAGPTEDYRVFLSRSDECVHLEGELWRLGKLPDGRRKE